MENHGFEMYRNLLLFLSKGIHISDILNFMGIDAIYVYGAGEMGELLLSDLSGRVKIPALFDKNYEKLISKKIWNQSEGICDRKKTWYEYPILSPEKIPDDDIMILITPASGYFDIITDLLGRGISKKRFLSLNYILYYGFYYMSAMVSDRTERLKDVKKFLIIGAQFGNKGAQNMLFVTISEIRKRYEDAVIWYLPNYWEEEYKDAWKIYRMIFLPSDTDEGATVHEVIPRLDGIFDISGTAWAVKGGTERNMRCFRTAYKYHIPIYFMPQSFKADAFDSHSEKELKKILSYARIVYCREEQGYEFLTNTLGLSNAARSEDLVLQNICLCEDYIFINKEKDTDYQLMTEHNVAVIPNTQNLKYGDPEVVLQLYKNIVYKLLELKKQIYIISHSEDEEICFTIYEEFMDNDFVHLYDKRFDCIGFRELIKNFEYTVSSRFHAIVNSYKEGVPCVVIGWLEKYKELTEKFQQSGYLFDVRGYMDMNDVIGAVAAMEKRWFQESKKISKILPELQKENCFDVLNNMG